MILPERLYDWAAERAHARSQKLHKAVMIVFPTQFGCLKIRDSLLEFRGHDYWTVNLRTGVDKDDRFLGSIRNSKSSLTDSCGSGL